MKYEVKSTNNFVKNLKRCMKRGRDEKLVQKVIKMLANGETLPAEYKTHKLKGKYKNCFECHIQPDWLLVWQQNEKELILILIDTGTHSDLF